MNWIKRSLLAQLSIFFIILILSVKLFDLALGASQRPETYTNIKRSLMLREHSPNVNANLKPDEIYISNTQNLTQKDFLLRTDKDGFIVGPKDFDKTDSEVSIIFFGGSTTECIYVEEERRFPYLVSESLRLRVLNGGVSGNHSMHSLLAMIGKGVPYKPKNIVLMHAVNDLVLLSKTLSYWDAPQTKALIQSDNSVNSRFVIYDIARQIKNFLVPNLWSKTRYLFSNSNDLIIDEYRSYRTRNFKYAELERALAEQFAASLRSFVRVSRSWDIEPILMTQFNRIKNEDVFIRERYEKTPQPISYNEFVLLYKAANDIVRTVAKEENVYLIDLDKLIPSTKEYIYDGVHLNTKGSELAAEKITDALRSRYPLVYR